MAGARSAQPALIEYLQEWKLNGNNIILWTCRVGEALSNNAGNKTSNLMPSMTTFRKSSNSTDTTAARYPATTILMTGCCFRKVQRHRTVDCYALKFSSIAYSKSHLSISGKPSSTSCTQTIF